MNDQLRVPIDVPLVGDARLKNWAKIVDNVDTGLDGGWAFDGEFVATGGIQDLPAPSVLLVYGERGSRGNPQSEARVFAVNTDATLTLHAVANGRAWARTLRDAIADLVTSDRPIAAAARPWDAALMGYATEALEEELRRRRPEVS